VAAAMAFRDSSSAALPQPTSIAFATAMQSPGFDTCSGPTTIESRQGAQATRTSQGIHVSLSGSSFFADSACAFSITSVDIGAGTSDATFYFKTGLVGSTTITASASGFADAMQTEN
jgi:hypothetical protein